MFFWWFNLVRLYSLYKILYPKGKIESYSIDLPDTSPCLSPEATLAGKGNCGGSKVPVGLLGE